MEGTTARLAILSSILLAKFIPEAFHALIVLCLHSQAGPMQFHDGVLLDVVYSSGVCS